MAKRGATMNFKIGDKVKILPSAVDISVAESEVGKVGIIIEIISSSRIYVDTPTERFGFWVVNEWDITPVVVIGQQLLLWEDLYV